MLYVTPSLKFLGASSLSMVTSSLSYYKASSASIHAKATGSISSATFGFLPKVSLLSFSVKPGIWTHSSFLQIQYLKFTLSCHCEEQRENSRFQNLVECLLLCSLLMLLSSPPIIPVFRKHNFFPGARDGGGEG